MGLPPPWSRNSLAYEWPAYQKALEALDHGADRDIRIFQVKDLQKPTRGSQLLKQVGP